MNVPKVAENRSAFAIRDINPRAPVHILILPREHIPTAQDITSSHGEVLADVFALSQEVAADEGISERGYRLIFNVGADAGMVISHLHMHLLGGHALGPEG